MVDGQRDSAVLAAQCRPLAGGDIRQPRTSIGRFCTLSNSTRSQSTSLELASPGDSTRAEAIIGTARNSPPPTARNRTAMLRPILLGTCLAITLAGCITQPRNPAQKAVNTALTGACLAAQLSPCRIQPSEPDRSNATEARAAAVRAKAQRDSIAANQDAARRSSCLTDTGPRLPVSSNQCAAYGSSD